MPEEKGEHLRLLLKILGELARLLLAGLHIPLIEGFLHLIERLQQIIGVAGHNYNRTDAQRGGQQQGIDAGGKACNQVLNNVALEILIIGNN